MMFCSRLSVAPNECPVKVGRVLPLGQFYFRTYILTIKKYKQSYKIYLVSLNIYGAHGLN